MVSTAYMVTVFTVWFWVRILWYQSPSCCCVCSFGIDSESSVVSTDCLLAAVCRQCANVLCGKFVDSQGSIWFFFSGFLRSGVHVCNQSWNLSWWGRLVNSVLCTRLSFLDNLLIDSGLFVWASSWVHMTCSLRTHLKRSHGQLQWVLKGLWSEFAMH